MAFSLNEERDTSLIATKFRFCLCLPLYTVAWAPFPITSSNTYAIRPSKRATQFPILRLQDGEIDVLIGFNGKDEQKKSVHLNMWGVVGLVKSREDMCHSQVHSVFVGMEERRGD